MRTPAALCIAAVTAVWLHAASVAGGAVVAHYSFDADCRDVSGNGNDGTLVDVGTSGNSGIASNAGETVFGGGALNLSADRDYVSVTSRTFSSGSPYSISFWAKKAGGDTAPWDMVIGQRDTTSFFIALGNNDGSTPGLRWRSSDSSAARQQDFASTSDTNWHHYAIVGNTASNILFYFDGALAGVGSNKLTGFIYDTIGEAYSSSQDFDFHGQLDEVWVFSEVLGAAAVSNLYAYNNPEPPSSNATPVLLYAFEGGYTDGSGLANHGTPSGGAALVSNAQVAAVGVGALQLDGADTSYVSLSTSIVFDAASPWTVAFWAQRAETGAQHGMVVGERGTMDDFIWLNDSFGGLRFRSSAATTFDFSAPKDTALHHYALVSTGAGALRLYVDGGLSNSLSGDCSFTIDTIGQAYSNSLHYGFSGLLDDVRVYAAALDGNSVSRLFQMRVTNAPPARLTFLHYAFDGDYADGSGLANDGTPSGGAALVTNAQATAVGAGALQLDGADASYVSLSTSIVFDAASPWTVAFWAQRAETGAQHGMVIGSRSNSNDFVWLNDSFNGLRFRSSSGATLDFQAPKDTALHHYALVASGFGGLQLYIDGAPGGALSAATAFKIDTVGQAYPTSSLHYGFSGLLDDVRVYGAALDGATILDLYRMTTNPATTNVADSVTRLHVVLQGGQSNSDGRGDPAGLPAELQSPQPSVIFYYRESSDVLTTLRPGTSASSQFGPEVTTGRGYETYIGGDATTRVAIIKYAVGGTSLHADWKPGGDATTAGDGPYYVTFQQTVSNGMSALRAAYTNALITVDGMTWMQGESDDSYASAYATNLATFIADVRATFQADLPFIIGRLSAGQTAVANLPVIQAAQDGVAAADPWTGIVNTDTFPVKTADHLHFDAAGQVALGQAFAYQLFYLQGLTNRFTPAQIASGNCEPGADADGDGASNEAEFLAGTDSTNAESVLKVNFSRGGDGVFAVSYPTAPDRLYAVETAPDMAGAAWAETLPLEASAATNATRAITNSAAAGFLRVRASLP